MGRRPHGNRRSGGLFYRHEYIITHGCSSSLVRRRRVLLWWSRHRRKRGWPATVDMPCHLFHGRIPHHEKLTGLPGAQTFKGRRMMFRLRSGASVDRRKHFRSFSDGGALPRRRYANRGRRSRVRRARAVRFPAGANIAQAFGHDAQAWAKYQCQARRADFQGDADDSLFHG